MEINLTHTFTEEIFEIVDYISLDSIDRANNFREEVYSSLNSLKQFPNLGTKLENGKRKLIIHKNYIIYYKIKKDIIQILSIKHVKKRE
ncbi:MAG: type II toxin-antitoxin system RelE/ParE family toxin [Nanoarchaeota archaeon]|nr:type II toxin-antitoxin system RelE/ParE family toxin [Nanoarchaeota archaeon]